MTENLMDEKTFILNFADLFDEINAEELTLETRFRDIDQWSSILALSVMAMCAEEYDVILSANEMENANLISDIYNCVQSKIQNS